MPDVLSAPDLHWTAKQSDQHREKSETFTRIYANNFGMTINNWDASLVFGEIIGEDTKGEPIIEEKVKVTMPLSLLKAMSQLLSINVAAFEKQFGEIIIPRVLAFQSPSASPSQSPSASTSPSTSASPSPEAEETDADT